MLHLHTALIERIKDQVPELKTVAGPELFMNESDDSNAVAFPACMVVPGAGTVVSQNTKSLPAIERQEFICVILIGYQYTDSADGQAEIQAGRLMKALYNGVHEYRVDTDTQRRPFKYDGRQPPTYANGYAEFPLSFTADTNI